MLVVGVVLVMRRAVRMLMFRLYLASLFAPLQELKQLCHSILDERVCNIRVFDLCRSVRFNCIFDRLHALLTFDAYIREVFLV